MPMSKKVLIVDDSRSLRSIVERALANLENSELLQAENGEKGLEAVEAHSPDLVLLDVTMPVMDGPQMLQELRARGNTIPVILLTAESKTSVIGPMLKLGFNDYIVKPFKNEELLAKVRKILDAGQAPPAPEVSAAEPAKKPWTEVYESAADLLLVDDMDNVAKKLRTMLPPHITMKSCLDSAAAIALCRRFAFRVVVQDLDIPNVNAQALFSQLRVLQPDAAFVALMIRVAEDGAQKAKQMGFSSVLTKPFNVEQVNDFLAAYFSTSELVTIDGNIIFIEPFKGSKDRYPVYFNRISRLVREAADSVAAACFDTVVLDLLSAPQSAEHLSKLAVFAANYLKAFDIRVKLLASQEICTMLKGITETAGLEMSSAREQAGA
jgi:two-component system, cell cycle response regulator